MSDMSWPGAGELAAALVGATGSSVRVILLYGSHLTDASPDRHSAFDFVVVVGDYASFYSGLSAAGELHRLVWLMTQMARVLPPNVIAFAPNEGEEGIAKCVIVSRDHLTKALGSEPARPLLAGAHGPDAGEGVDRESRGRVLDRCAAGRRTRPRARMDGPVPRRARGRSGVRPPHGRGLLPGRAPARVTGPARPALRCPGPPFSGAIRRGARAG